MEELWWECVEMNSCWWLSGTKCACPWCGPVGCRAKCGWCGVCGDESRLERVSGFCNCWETGTWCSWSEWEGCETASQWLKGRCWECWFWLWCVWNSCLWLCGKISCIGFITLFVRTVNCRGISDGLLGSVFMFSITRTFSGSSVLPSSALTYMEIQFSYNLRQRWA